MPILHHDIESRSAISLKDLGVYRYAIDPTTAVLCVSYAVDNEEPKLWWPGQAIPQEFVEAARDPAWLLCGHNSQFERVLTQYVLAPRYGWPLIDPRRWRCTMSMAAAMSLPQELDELATVLDFKQRKDAEGAKLMLDMCRPRRKRKGDVPGVLYWVEDAASMDRLGTYCIQDTRVEQEAHGRLEQLPSDELEYWHHCNAINDRGIPFDRRLAEASHKIALAAEPDINGELRTVTNGAVSTVGQIEKIRQWLRAHDCDVENLRTDTLTPLLDDEDLDRDARYVITLRLGGASAASKKANAILDRSYGDDRIRGVYRFQGCSTGRYSSRGAQFQNLKNPTIETEEGITAAIDAVMTGDLAHVKSRYPRPLQVLGDIARSMVMASPGRRLIGADYSNLESRVLAWCAGQDDKLDQFARHDVTQLDEHETYRITASKLLGIPIEKVGKAERKIGKTCDLGLGYCAGHRGLAKQLKHLTEDERRHLVKLWRRQHPHIENLWNQVQSATVRCVRTGQPTTAGPFQFSCDNMFMKALLPSGRTIYFAFPKMMVDSHGFPTVTYMSRDSRTRKWGHVNHGRGAYGGLICQNLIQGLSRDLLSGAMVRVEAAGYPVVMTTHDELTAEAAEGFGGVEELVDIMIEQPSWAPGLPLNAKGWEGQRYG